MRSTKTQTRDHRCMTLRFPGWRQAGILVLLLSSVRCDRVKTEMKDAINRSWPPVSTFDRRARALVASANALPSEPTLYLALDQVTLSQILDEVQAQVANARFSQPGANLPVISNLKTKADSEALSVVVDIAIDLHRMARIGWLRAAVLGANDGILLTASLVLGVATAHGAHNNILVAGVAGLVAGSMSMAAGEYVFGALAGRH
jgi:hypothetical protein